MVASTVPAVSVLMPAYNTGRYLAQAIESILRQTLRDFELLIVDDGSKDRTLEIAERYAAVDGRVRIKSRENRGLVETRNELLELASGDLVAWADSDDWYEPERLAVQAARFAAEPELVACGSAWRMVDDQGLPIMEFRFPEGHEAIYDMMEDVDNALCFPTVMMKRRAALQVGKFRHPFVICEDYDLLLRLSEAGRMANVPEVLLNYRQHIGSTVGSGHWRAPVYSRMARALALERRALGSDRLQRGEPVDLRFDPDWHPRMNAMHLHHKWGWWALMDGKVRTARKHAWLMWRAAPLNVESYRLMYCAMRGH